MGGGGSFLGTAAATVAGVVGGAMLMNGIRSMMGGHEGFSPGHDPSGGLPHSASPGDSGGSSGHGSGGDQGNDPLSRDAGLGDIGGGGHRTAAWDTTTTRTITITATIAAASSAATSMIWPATSSRTTAISTPATSTGATAAIFDTA